MISLASLTIFVVPLIALLISHDAIVGEIERGTMTLLLSYPIRRRQVLLGKFLGHLAILAFATCVGYGLAALALVAMLGGIGGESWTAFATMTASSVLLGAVFVAIGYLVSALARDRGTAAGIAIGIWLVFVVIYDMALLGILVADQGHYVSGSALNALLLFNPTDAYRILNLSGSTEIAAASGMAGSVQSVALAPMALIAALDATAEADGACRTRLLAEGTVKPHLKIGLLASLLVLGACQRAPEPPPAPFAMTEEVMGRYCGMNILEHAGPKGQVILARYDEPIWFSSARDTIAAFASSIVIPSSKWLFTSLPGRQAGRSPVRTTGLMPARPSSSSAAIAKAAWERPKPCRFRRKRRRGPSPATMAAGWSASTPFRATTYWTSRTAAAIRRSSPPGRSIDMISETMTRRRMIAISAAAAGMALLPPHGKAAQEGVTWQGEAMGAQASLVIHHPDRAMALKLTNDVVAEVRRLERIFSLYMDDSDLTRLNRQRFLIAPPRELVDILRQSREVWTLTGGAFDPTVQPLWDAYRRHFSTSGAAEAGPSAQIVRECVGRGGLDRVACIDQPDRPVGARRGTDA